MLASYVSLICQPSTELVQEHYRDHVSKDFYDGLCKLMSSGPVAAMVTCSV